MKNSPAFDSLRCLMNDNGSCFVCKKSILDHSDQDLLTCGEKRL